MNHKYYHYDTCAKAHENYVRKECLEIAYKRDRHALRSAEDLVEEAKVFERYVLNEPKCRVVYLKVD